MNSSNSITGTIVAVVALAVAGHLLLTVKSDRAKYEELKIGMTTREVQAIVGPKTGRYGAFHTDLGDNETLTISDVMELTFAAADSSTNDGSPTTNAADRIGPTECLGRLLQAFAFVCAFDSRRRGTLGDGRIRDITT